MPSRNHLRLLPALAALSPTLLPAQDLFTGIDPAKAGFSYAGGMDFDNVPGEIESYRFELGAFLGKPLELGGDWKLATSLRYRLNSLEIDGTPPAFPAGDETLHNLALQGFLIRSTDSSPWLYGAWAQAALSSDLEDIDGDDFLFDVGGGIGYKFSPRFTLFAGAMVTELNGDEQVLPGIAFNWKVNDCIDIGMFGPNFTAAWKPDENWIFSLKTESGGGVWNTDGPGGVSTRLEFRSLQVGLHAERRLMDTLWLGLGAGGTTGNKIETGTPDGLTTFKDHADTGWFVYTGLRLAQW